MPLIYYDNPLRGRMPIIYYDNPSMCMDPPASCAWDDGIDGGCTRCHNGADEHGRPQHQLRVEVERLCIWASKQGKQACVSVVVRVSEHDIMRADGHSRPQHQLRVKIRRLCAWASKQGKQACVSVIMRASVLYYSTYI